MALLFLMGCAVDEQPETSRIAAATLPSSPSAPPTPTSEPCPNLDPLLRELSQSDDPLSLVGVNNLILTPDGLLVPVVRDGAYLSALGDGLEPLCGGVKDGTGLVNWVRAIKSPKEIAYMRQAAKVCDKVMRTAVEAIQPGKLERAAAAGVYHACVMGTDDAAGDHPACGSNPRSTTRRRPRTRRKPKR